ncbi:unnamed protein product [Brassica oleracea var. botrytis]
MEKISMKVALVIFLVVASVVSIEATRLLTEEALETVFLGESLPHVIINVDKQQSHRSEETLETVLHGESLPHGESWLHGVKLRDPIIYNCKKGYRVFVCYEVLTKEERSRRVLCISKPLTICRNMLYM